MYDTNTHHCRAREAKCQKESEGPHGYGVGRYYVFHFDVFRRGWNASSRQDAISRKALQQVTKRGECAILVMLLAKETGGEE